MKSVASPLLAQVSSVGLAFLGERERAWKSLPYPSEARMRHAAAAMACVHPRFKQGLVILWS